MPTIDILEASQKVELWGMTLHVISVQLEDALVGNPGQDRVTSNTQSW